MLPPHFSSARAADAAAAAAIASLAH